MRRPGSLLPLALVLAALPLAAQTAPAPSAADLLDEITSTEQLQAAGKAVQEVTSAAAEVATSLITFHSCRAKPAIFGPASRLGWPTGVGL